MGFRLSSLALALLFLGACSPFGSGRAPAPAPAGHVIGNAGGGLLARFEHGRRHALNVLARLTPEYFARYSATNPSVSAKDIAWISDPGNRQAIVAEVTSMRLVTSDPLPLDLCPFHGRAVCGCTLPTPGEPLFLSAEGCSDVRTEARAGEILLHEALHHLLGAEEARIYALAALAYARWSPGHAPFVQVLTPFGSGYETAGRLDTLPGWDGKHFFVIHPTAFRLWEYDPVSSRQSVASLHWSVVPKDSDGQPDWELLTHRRVTHAVIGASAGGHALFLYSDNRNTLPSKSSVGGYWYAEDIDLTSHRITAFPGMRPERLPLADCAVVYLAPLGERILLSGTSYEPSGDGLSSRARLEAAIYDPARGRWEVLPPLALGETSDGTFPIQAYFGDRILFWNPASRAPTSGTGSPSGFLFEEKRGSWIPMSEKGRPEPRERPVTAAAGDRLLVYGGFPTGGTHAAVDTINPGGIFDPGRNLWLPLGSQGAPEGEPRPDPREPGFLPRSPLEAVWAAPIWIVKGRDLRFYRPDTNQWSLADQGEGQLPLSPTDLFSTGIELIFYDRYHREGYLMTP